MRAVRQHGAFVSLLTELGAEVEEVLFVDGMYDSVFVKDSAVLVRRPDGDHALLAHPYHRERRAEQAARRTALESKRFSVHPAPRQSLEGGDVVMLPDRRGAFMGHDFRSSLASAADLERVLDVPVYPLQLCSPHLYHLDMAVTVLDDETVLVCEEALTGDSVRVLRRAAKGEVISVGMSHARRFALNVVEVGRHLVLPGDFPALRQSLSARGWSTHAIALDEFHNAGGSAGCLVSRVHADRRVAKTSLGPTAA
jgi:N-dimethylarginine dimethylaminohydrolase